METSKEERPVAKRPFETSKEDGSMAAKVRRIGNHDSQNLESKVDKNLKPLIPSSLEAQNVEDAEPSGDEKKKKSAVRVHFVLPKGKSKFWFHDIFVITKQSAKKINKN